MRIAAILVVLVFLVINGLAAQENSMVRINGGTFTMGSPANEVGRDSGEVQRQVTVSAFSMSRYPVTQSEYQSIMGINPSSFKGDNLPVECVTWFDAIEYCIKRSQKEGLTPAYTISNRNPATGYPITGAAVTVSWNANGYRLPTEAEWEYACRAGTTTPFNTGNNITTSQANYDYIYKKTTPGGSFPANAWGLYDMHGNVWEWCWDWHDRYAEGEQTNPRGGAGHHRVFRGGCWFGSGGLRSAYRHYGSPDFRNYVLGFRVVRP